jgi:hypothetical protein
MHCYNLKSIVAFPARVELSLGTITDNVISIKLEMVNMIYTHS